MKRLLAIACLLALTLGPAAEAARVRVVHHGHRTRVTVRTGFPIHRSLPQVYLRAPRVAIRVTPRVFLPPVVFGARVLGSLPAEPRGWHEEETLDREEGWTEFTMPVEARGTRLLLDITGGAAQLSFAEVVFENGETQVVDFNDHSHKLGIYGLLDFDAVRNVDHVRLVAKASAPSSTIGLHLL